MFVPVSPSQWEYKSEQRPGILSERTRWVAFAERCSVTMFKANIYCNAAV